MRVGDHQESGEYFHEALRFALEVRAVPQILIGLVGIATLLASSERPDLERSAELLAFFLSHPASYKTTQDKAKRGLAELASDLPPEVMAAAQERGKASELERVVAEVLAEMAL